MEKTTTVTSNISTNKQQQYYQTTYNLFPPPLLIAFPSQSVTRLSRLNQIAILPILLAIRLRLIVLFVPRIFIPLPAPPLPGPLIKLIQHLLRDAIQQFLGVNPQQTPREVDALVDGAALVRRLVDEGAFELVEEFQGELVFGREGFLADDGFHGGGVPADGVFGVELVGDVAVVFAGVAFADGGFHEPGEGGEHVDGGVDALVVELTVDEDLAFGDVAREIGDGMGDVWEI